MNKQRMEIASTIWKSWNLKSEKIPKIQILKIQIRSAQSVGKVWISRKKTFPAPFGAIPGHFLRGPEKSKKLPIFLGGPLLLSTLGGAIGIRFLDIDVWDVLFRNHLDAENHG